MLDGRVKRIYSSDIFHSSVAEEVLRHLALLVLYENKCAVAEFYFHNLESFRMMTKP